MPQTIKKRKCRNCHEFFRPDCRNARKQQYCSKPECRKASKAASNARWLAKKENKNYHSGHHNVVRVQEWRKLNPGYSQRKGTIESKTLQDHLSEKTTKKQDVPKQLTPAALQDLLMDQHAVLVGLIAHLTGKALQDDIYRSTLRMQQLGNDVLNSSTPNLQGGNYADKKTYSPRPDPPGT